MHDDLVDIAMLAPETTEIRVSALFQGKLILQCFLGCSFGVRRAGGHVHCSPSSKKVLFGKAVLL